MTGLNHPQTPNILFLITLQCTCARCLFVFHTFHQSGTHSFYTLGICYHQSTEICALVRLQQHLILYVFRDFCTLVIVCVVSLHTVSCLRSESPCCKLQPGILHLIQGIDSAHLLGVLKLYETEPNNLHSCMAFLSDPFDLSTYNNLTLPHLGIFLGRLPMPLEVHIVHTDILAVSLQPLLSLLLKYANPNMLSRLDF